MCVCAHVSCLYACVSTYITLFLDGMFPTLSHRLHKRQSPSTTSGIGTTAHLSGDNHNQAVVHWTGYPSERIFIVTRARIGFGRGKQAHSRESWLWR